MLRHQPDVARRARAVGKTRELTELLFQQGMDPNAADWLGITTLHRLAEKGDVENAALFIDQGADLQVRDEDICSTPLGWAAKAGKIEMVRFLLDRGAKSDLPDDPPWATPLAWAIRRGHAEIASTLRERGARS
jgi:ankyrin repeat protein